MKKLKIIVAILAIVTMAATSFGIPFAAQLDRSSPTFGPGFSFIYFLNQAAATVTIKVYDVPGGSTVASFAGTTSRGLNTVPWDGTDNNSGGTPVPPGTYTFAVLVTGSEAPGWARIASNSTVASTKTTEYKTLPDGWPSRSIIVGTEPTQESYGIVFVSVAATGGWIGGKNGIILLNPDTSLYNGSTLYMNHDNMNAGYTDVWQTSWDPEDYTLWIAGQGPVGAIFRGTWNSPTSTDVTGDQIGTIQYARSVTVKGTGASRTLYICKALGQIWRYQIGTASNLTGLTGTDILGQFAGADWYSKVVRFDTAGNAYWIGRYEATGPTAAHLERWDSAVFDAATANSLNDTNASWNVQIGTGTGVNAGGIAIYKKNPADPNDDEIYVSLNSTAECGIYYVGYAGEATKTGLITNRVVDLSAEAGTFSAYGCDITADAVGNLYLQDGASEVVYVYSPGGASSNSTPAPATKNFEIPAPPPTAAKEWLIYQ